MSEARTRSQEFRTRLLFAPLLLVTIVGIFFLDRAYGGGRYSAAVFGLLSILGMFEYVTMMRGARFPVGRTLLLLGATCLAVFPFLFESWDKLDTELYPPVLLTTFMVFLTSVRALARSQMPKGLEEMGSTMLGLLLVAWPMYFAQGLALRSLDAMFFLVLVSKSGDIGGYCAGMLLGRRKLIPHVSPGKSIEGSLGSLVFACLVAFLLFDALLGKVGDLGQLSLPGILGIGALINVTTQIGDLVESVLKRRCGVKDSSSMLPVHGGVLDLVDSLLFSVPSFFFVLVRLT